MRVMLPEPEPLNQLADRRRLMDTFGREGKPREKNQYESEESAHGDHDRQDVRLRSAFTKSLHAQDPPATMQNGQNSQPECDEGQREEQRCEFRNEKLREEGLVNPLLQ